MSEQHQTRSRFLSSVFICV